MRRTVISALVDPSQPDAIVKALAESFDLAGLGDCTYAEMTLKSSDSLLQCPLTTIQIPIGWVRCTASTAKPVSIFESGAAPSDFALNFVNDRDLRNRNYV